MKVAALYRYPIKGIGRERVDNTDLAPDAPMPGDRAWAVTHRTPPPEGWAPKAAFLQVMQGPRLAAVTLRSEDDVVTLAHPDLGIARFSLPGEAESLIEWVTPLWPEDRSPPVDLCPAPAKGMGDNGAARLHLLGQGSLAALSDAAGREVEALRFRPNVVLEGVDPWAELGWTGRRLRLGDAVLEVTERTGRCRATEADPETGVRNMDVVALLREKFGHTDTGVYLRVIEGGRVATGDAAELA